MTAEAVTAAATSCLLRRNNRGTRKVAIVVPCSWNCIEETWPESNKKGGIEAVDDRTRAWPASTEAGVSGPTRAGWKWWMGERMDGWMDGRMDGWTDGWMDVSVVVDRCNEAKQLESVWMRRHPRWCRGGGRLDAAADEFGSCTSWFSDERLIRKLSEANFCEQISSEKKLKNFRNVWGMLVMIVVTF